MDLSQLEKLLTYFLDSGEEVAHSIHAQSLFLRGWRGRTRERIIDLFEEGCSGQVVRVEAADQSHAGEERSSQPLFLAREDPGYHDRRLPGRYRFHHGVVSAHGDDQIGGVDVLLKMGRET